MAVLKRRLRRIDALAVALGTVIGIGVFRNTGLVLRGADGFVGATLLWFVCGVLVFGGAVIYADLSSRVPEAGGPYAYVRVGFGPRAAFAYGWLNAGVVIPTRQASTAVITGELLSRWLPASPSTLALSLYLTLAALHLCGVRAGAFAQRVFMIGKLATVGLVIVLAVVLGSTRGPVAPAHVAPVSFGLALSAVWYTYLGWQDVVLLAEELHQPRRDLPIVLVTTIGLTMALFLGLHLAVYWGLGGGAEAYASDPMPALHVARHVLGATGEGVLNGLMIASLIGVTAAGLLVRPRIAMALARDGLGPAPLARVNALGTPYGALIFQVTIASVMIMTGSYVTLLQQIGFTMGVLGLFEIASYFAVRKKRRELPTSRLHPWAPLAFLVMSGALCVLTGRDHPMGIVTAAVILGAMSIVYVAARPRLRVTMPPPAPDLPEARIHAGPRRPDAET